MRMPTASGFPRGSIHLEVDELKCNLSRVRKALRSCHRRHIGLLSQRTSPIPRGRTGRKGLLPGNRALEHASYQKEGDDDCG